MKLPFLMLLFLSLAVTQCRSARNSDLKATMLESQLVSFNSGGKAQAYSFELAKRDFAGISRGPLEIGRIANISIDAENNLVFKQNAGKVASTGGGGQILVPIAPTRELTLEYEIYFDGNGGEYDWTWGGKLPGVGGGKRYFGGAPANAGDGFSARFMFGDQGRIFAYVYHKDMPGKYGDALGVSRLKIFKSNTWHRVKISYKVNQGEKANGVLRAWVDDQFVGERLDLRYSTNDSAIDTLHIPLFHGGGSAEYFPEKDQFIKLRKLSLRGL